jgi:hypothetical protein
MLQAFDLLYCVHNRKVTVALSVCLSACLFFLSTVALYTVICGALMLFSNTLLPTRPPPSPQVRCFSKSLQAPQPPPPAAVASAANRAHAHDSNRTTRTCGTYDDAGMTSVRCAVPAFGSASVINNNNNNNCSASSAVVAAAAALRVACTIKSCAVFSDTSVRLVVNKSTCILWVLWD